MTYFYQNINRAASELEDALKTLNTRNEGNTRKLSLFLAVEVLARRMGVTDNKAREYLKRILGDKIQFPKFKSDHYDVWIEVNDGHTK